jgi:hypothetical protein
MSLVERAAYDAMYDGHLHLQDKVCICVCGGGGGADSTSNTPVPVADVNHFVEDCAPNRRWDKPSSDKRRCAHPAFKVGSFASAQRIVVGRPVPMWHSEHSMSKQ